MPGSLKIAYIFSAMIALLAAIVSAAGVFLPVVYRHDVLWASSQSRGNDLVTLVVAVPVLLVSLILSVRGSMRGRLVWLGSLGYMLYGYVFYLYGIALNELFLAYVAIVALSLWALILGLMSTNADEIAARFSARTTVKTVGGYLVFIGVFLTLMWVPRAASIFSTGNLPADVIASGTKAAVVYATDLSFLVPATIVAGLLLWRHRPWGYLLGGILLVKETTYPVALLGMGVFAKAAGSSADLSLMPFWAAFAAVSLVLTMWYLWRLEPAAAAATAAADAAPAMSA